MILRLAGVFAVSGFLEPDIDSTVHGKTLPIYLGNTASSQRSEYFFIRDNTLVYGGIDQEWWEQWLE
jgi:hypothetical protein